ncbi:MAG: hypothetical protein MK110_02250 [Fuerstiella sp.]|nr:hypothetical protein [Fuerstiella sp.]
MSITNELSVAWDGLDAAELDAVGVLATSIGGMSRPLEQFLRSAVDAELKHRDELRVKPLQAPDFDAWSDADVAHGYFAAVTIETASHASERLAGWGSCLLHTVCGEMATRLLIRHSATEVLKRCDNN